MRRSTWLLATLLWAGCGAGPSRPSAPSPAPAAASEPDVPVATYLNPGLTTDTTQDRITRLFAANQIRWVAGGSLGFTLSVPVSQAALARRVLRSDPTLAANVTVIDEAELQQILAPPVPLAPQFRIARADLDAELTNLDALLPTIGVSWNQGGGVRVDRIAPSSLFARMGWRARDVITAVDGARVSSEADAIRVLGLAKTRPALSIDLERGGQAMTMQLVVTAGP